MNITDVSVKVLGVSFVVFIDFEDFFTNALCLLFVRPFKLAKYVVDVHPQPTRIAAPDWIVATIPIQVLIAVLCGVVDATGGQIQGGGGVVEKVGVAKTSIRVRPYIETRDPRARQVENLRTEILRNRRQGGHLGIVADH